MLDQKYGKFNCYKILEIDSNASPESIRFAYKKASLAHHPDKGGSHEDQVNINLAYSILSDPIQRHSHDTFWKVFSYSETKPYTGQVKYTPGKESPVPPTQTSANPSQILRGLKQRIFQEIETEKKRILEDLDNRIQNARGEINKVLSKKRQEAIWLMFLTAAFGYAAIYFEFQCIWIPVAYWIWILLSSIFGVKVESHRISILNFSSKKLNNYAEKIAKESCEKDIGGLEQYISILAYISELLARPSTFDDSEDQVARRLAVSFFLMGYIPSYYERESRILKFVDGESNFLVRFRHRSGIPTNIKYVEKLVDLMESYDAIRGFVFCSPGLSGNAAVYAEENNIKWYTLETMNSWIEGVLISDHSGPQGNILQHLNGLRNLVLSIAPAIAAPRRRSPRQKYRRYRY